MTLPVAMQTAVGIADGDLVEVRMSHGKIVLTPRPQADDVAELESFVEAAVEKKSNAMRIVLSDRALKSLRGAPLLVRKAFYK